MAEAWLAKKKTLEILASTTLVKLPTEHLLKFLTARLTPLAQQIRTTFTFFPGHFCFPEQISAQLGFFFGLEKITYVELCMSYYPWQNFDFWRHFCFPKQSCLFLNPTPQPKSLSHISYWNATLIWQTKKTPRKLIFANCLPNPAILSISDKDYLLI